MEKTRLLLEMQSQLATESADAAVFRQKYEEEATESKAAKDELGRVVSKQKEDAARELKEHLRRQREAFEAELAALRKSLEVQFEAERKKWLAEQAAKKPAENAKPKPKVGGSKVLAGLDLDEDSDKPIHVQLQEALSKQGARVMDLFREWDADGDGEVSKDEFRKAMPMLGLDYPMTAMDALFDSFDKDGGGTIDFKEIQKMMRRPPGSTTTTQATKKLQGAANLVAAAGASKEGGGKDSKGAMSVADAAKLAKAKADVSKPAAKPGRASAPTGQKSAADAAKGGAKKSLAAAAKAIAEDG